MCIFGFDEGCSSLGAIFVSEGSLPTAFSSLLENVTGNFEKCTFSILGRTFSQGSYIPRAGRNLFLRLSVSMRSIEMSPLHEVTTSTGDFNSVGIVRSFAILIDAWSCYWNLEFLSDSMLETSYRSMFLNSIVIMAECISLIYLSKRKIPLSIRSMCVVPNKLSKAKCSTTPNQVRGYRGPIFPTSPIIACFVIHVLVAAPRLEASRRFNAKFPMRT